MGGQAGGPHGRAGGRGASARLQETRLKGRQMLDRTDKKPLANRTAPLSKASRDVNSHPLPSYGSPRGPREVVHTLEMEFTPRGHSQAPWCQGYPRGCSQAPSGGPLGYLGGPLSRSQSRDPVRVREDRPPPHTAPASRPALGSLTERHGGERGSPLFSGAPVSLEPPPTHIVPSRLGGQRRAVPAQGHSASPGPCPLPSENRETAETTRRRIQKCRCTSSAVALRGGLCGTLERNISQIYCSVGAPRSS